MDRDSGRRVTVVPTVLMACSRQAREKRVSISPAATPPSRAQFKSQNPPEMRHFRLRQSPATSPSPVSFRSHSTRIEIPRTRLRNLENPSAKSVKRGSLFSESDSPARGVFWPPGQKMKNGGPSSIELELSSRPTMRPTTHPTSEVCRTSRPRASGDSFGTSASLNIILCGTVRYGPPSE